MFYIHTSYTEINTNQNETIYKQKYKARFKPFLTWNICYKSAHANE